MTEFEKSLAWMKEFIDDVEDDARVVFEDDSESWLGAWCNPTKEQFLHHLTIVSNYCPPRPDTGQDSVLDAPVIGDRRGELGTRSGDSSETGREKRENESLRHEKTVTRGMLPAFNFKPKILG